MRFLKICVLLSEQLTQFESLCNLDKLVDFKTFENDFAVVFWLRGRDIIKVCRKPKSRSALSKTNLIFQQGAIRRILIYQNLSICLPACNICRSY